MIYHSRLHPLAPEKVSGFFTKHFLVGGFNPSEKYAKVKMGSSSPKFGVKIKTVWNHHLVFVQRLHDVGPCNVFPCPEAFWVLQIQKTEITKTKSEILAEINTCLQPETTIVKLDGNGDFQPFLYVKIWNHLIETTIKKWSGWCFQPIWKILVKLDHFPGKGENRKYLKQPLKNGCLGYQVDYFY